jgi:hypothetical protein
MWLASRIFDWVNRCEEMTSSLLVPGSRFRREHQIMKIEAEIGERRHCRHLHMLYASIRLQREIDKRIGIQASVPPPGFKRVVLPVLEVCNQGRRARKLQHTLRAAAMSASTPRRIELFMVPPGFFASYELQRV